MSDPKATMRHFGIGDHALLVLRRKVQVAGSDRYALRLITVFDMNQSKCFASRTIEQDSEMMRLQLLGDPSLMAQLESVRVCCTGGVLFNLTQ